MNNRFIITICRPHTKEKDKVLAIGHFEENSIGANKLSVRLDQRELSYQLEEKERMTVNEISSKGILITKDYCLWIDLPGDWKDAKRLQIVNSCAGEEQIAHQSSTSKLSKKEKVFEKNIDNESVVDGGFSVTGWYINTGDVDMRFFDMSGNELGVAISKKRRVDVNHVFPENTEDEIIGFEAIYKGEVPRKVRLHFESKDKQEDCVIKLIISPMGRAFNKGKRLLAKLIMHCRRFGVKATLRKCLKKITRQDSITYKKWLKQNYPSRGILEEQRKHKFAYRPKISIVIPLYKTPQRYLDELVNSIKTQSYDNWELCFSDGSGDNSPLTSVLQKYEAEDDRIKVVHNGKPLQISENTNAALKIATGDYIAFADHDDLLAPNALHECVCALNEDATIEMIYTDEDKIDMAGKEHFAPHFKSDFNIDMLRSVNYFCHLVVVKREIYLSVGDLDHEFDGAQDYDFVLRCVEIAKNIKHIPKILYHWRAHKDSTAENPESKNYAFEAGARAIQAHYDRLDIKAVAAETIHKGIYRSKYILQENPLISIVIPNKDHIDDLDKCISSIEEKSNYKNYEFIVVENNSTDKGTFEYYKKLEETCPRAKVVYWQGQGFNYPAINNYGVEYASGDYILFLNNDTEIVNADCLEEMLGYCMREDVGAVGARLYYEDGSIQHAGVIVGLGGIAGHAFVGLPHMDLGYFGRIQMAQDYSAVTAACIMVKRFVFEEVEGFDEKYAVAFNDIDLCMKIRKAGYLIVYNPYAELNHYESKSRGYEDSEEKIQRFNAEAALFRGRWKDALKKGDPYYNPNLTLEKSDFSLSVRTNKIKE